MKRIKILFLALSICFFSIANVKAATCDSTEENRLGKIAGNVRATYEEVLEEIDSETFSPPDGLTEEMLENYVGYETLFKVYITNLTEDLYLKVQDSQSGKTITYNYEDTESGTLTIRNENIYRMNTYKITVYAKSGDCADKKLKSLEIKIPMYNEYYASDKCMDNKEYYLCYKYVNYELPEFDEFITKIAKYNLEKEKKNQKEEEEKKKQGFGSFFEKNKALIITVSTIIVLAGVGTTVVIIVRRRRVL